MSYFGPSGQQAMSAHKARSHAFATGLHGRGAGPNRLCFSPAPKLDFLNPFSISRLFQICFKLSL
jgi:hypothetical protein